MTKKGLKAAQKLHKEVADEQEKRQRVIASKTPPFEIGQKVKAGVAVRGPVLALERAKRTAGHDKGDVLWWVWVRNEQTGVPSSFTSNMVEAV